MAAPIGSQVLGEVLPYMELTKDNQNAIEEKITVVIPDVRNKTVEEATKILKEAKLDIDVELEEGDNKSEIYVTEQVPKPGIIVEENSKISCQISK